MLISKKYEKIVKILGMDKVNELQLLSVEEQKEQVVNAEQAIKQAQDELEAMPKYQELKENLKDLSEGLKEVRKRQKAISQLCLSMLEDIK